MKKQIIFNFTFVFLFVLNIKAQNATFNNVAIGTDYPAYGTTIKSNFPGYNGTWARGFSVSNETGSQSFFTFASLGSAINGVSSVTSSFIGKDFDNRYMTFLPSGNVGIGTTTPDAKLEVVGDNPITLEVAGFYNAKAYGNANDKSEARINIGKLEGTIRQPMGAIGAFPLNNTDSSNGILVFYTRKNQSVIERLRINDKGYVGIGSTNPSGKLEITGDSGVYSDFASYSGTTINNYLPNGKEPTLVISEKLTGTFTPAVDRQVTYRGGLSFGRGGPGIYSINPNPAGSEYYGEIRFHTTYWNGSNYNNADRMVIKLDGNVGIGTTTPDAKLTVNGNIHAKEVKIDLSIPAPDYVFASDYKLKTLQEVEEYINKNSHLPEIPSAKEIEKNGLMLAEMNMNLLKKVEELTLYVIEQEKKNAKQSDEIEISKKQIEALKKENESFKTLSERFSKIESQLKTTK